MPNKDKEKYIFFIIIMICLSCTIIASLFSIYLSRDEEDKCITSNILTYLSIPLTFIGILSILFSLWLAKSGYNKHIVFFGIFSFILLLVFCINIFFSLYYSETSSSTDCQKDPPSGISTAFGLSFTALSLILIIGSIMWLIIDSFYTSAGTETSTVDEIFESDWVRNTQDFPREHRSLNNNKKNQNAISNNTVAALTYTSNNEKYHNNLLSIEQPPSLRQPPSALDGERPVTGTPPSIYKS